MLWAPRAYQGALCEREAGSTAWLGTVAALWQEAANWDAGIGKGEAQILSGQDWSSQRRLSKQTLFLISMSQAIIVSCVS